MFHIHLSTCWKITDSEIATSSCCVVQHHLTGTTWLGANEEIHFAIKLTIQFEEPLRIIFSIFLLFSFVSQRVIQFCSDSQFHYIETIALGSLINKYVITWYCRDETLLLDKPSKTILTLDYRLVRILVSCIYRKQTTDGNWRYWLIKMINP